MYEKLKNHRKIESQLNWREEESHRLALRAGHLGRSNHKKWEQHPRVGQAKNWKPGGSRKPAWLVGVLLGKIRLCTFPSSPTSSLKWVYLCCSSVAKSCTTLCNSIHYGMPDSSVLHYLPEFAQIHVYWIGDINQLILCRPFFCLPSFPESESSPGSIAGVQPRWIQGIRSGDGVGEDQETTA